MDWASQLTVLDIIVLAIFAFFVGRGIWVGFIRQISVIIAMFSGYIAAGQLHSRLYPHILPFFKNGHVAFLLTYAILFVVIYLVVMLLGRGLQKVMDVSMMVWFDRTMGGLLGAAKGVFLASLLFMVLAAFLSSGSAFLQDAKTFPVLKTCSQIFLAVVRDHDLKTRFLPRELAITQEVITESLKPETPVTAEGSGLEKPLESGSEPAESEGGQVPVPPVESPAEP